MPIYEYECPKCGRFEAVQKADAKPLKAKPDCDCKDCPKKAVRLISASAFHLKGSGWYKTDYSSGSSSSGSSPSTSGSKSEKSSSSSSESSSTSDTKKGGCGSGGCSSC